MKFVVSLNLPRLIFELKTKAEFAIFSGLPKKTTVKNASRFVGIIHITFLTQWVRVHAFRHWTIQLSPTENKFHIQKLQFLNSCKSEPSSWFKSMILMSYFLSLGFSSPANAASVAHFSVFIDYMKIEIQIISVNIPRWTRYRVFWISWDVTTIDVILTGWTKKTAWSGIFVMSGCFAHSGWPSSRQSRLYTCPGKVSLGNLAIPDRTVFVCQTFEIGIKYSVE